MTLLLSKALVAELDELNDEQRQAALHQGNVVLTAGPGSGKTRTVVARATYLLESQISPFRGLACITYTNAAADEIRRRVARLGAQTGRRLVCSTLHSFCLNEILRRYSALTNFPVLEPPEVLGERSQADLLQWCFDELRIADLQARFRLPVSTKIRRVIACGEDLRQFDAREVAAAELYEEQLSLRNEIDYESMVTRALQAVRSDEHVRDLLHARFPHVLVDEYQDLGGVLHELVVALVDQAGISVFAVGDADQSVFGFTGADPRYLNSLQRRDDFADLPLSINYRSGQRIIAAAEAALGIPHGRVARDNASPGEIIPVSVDGGLDTHAAAAVEIINESLAQGIRLDRIAVLYPSRGPVLDSILSELSAQAIPFIHERDERLPPGTLSEFVQRCASRSLADYYLQTLSADELEKLDHFTGAPSVMNLKRTLGRLRDESGLERPRLRFELVRRLQAALAPRESPYRPDFSAMEWLENVAVSLDFSEIAARHPLRDNRSAIANLLAIAQADELELHDLARFIGVVGKATVTTYHGAKGREFHTVILPGLLSGILPRRVDDRGVWRDPDPVELAEQRRTFYVAITRAEERVHLIVGPGYFTRNGYWWEKGPSDFVIDMFEILDEQQ